MKLEEYDHTKKSLLEATGITHDVILQTINFLSSKVTEVSPSGGMTFSQLLELVEKSMNDPCCKRVMCYLALTLLSD